MDSLSTVSFLIIQLAIPPVSTHIYIYIYSCLSYSLFSLVFLPSVSSLSIVCVKVETILKCISANFIPYRATGVADTTFLHTVNLAN